MIKKPSGKELEKRTMELGEEVERLQHIARLDEANRQPKQETADCKQSEEAPSRELEVNRSIAELAKALISSRSLNEISLFVLEQARRLTESELGYAGYIDPQTGYLICPTMTREISETNGVNDKGIVFKKFKGLWGWGLKNRKTILVNKAKTDPRATETPLAHVPIHRFLAAPALINDILVGQVAVANSHRNYSHQDLEFIEHLATFYAIAIEREVTGTNYREIFNAANDGILIHLEDTGNILQVNHKFTEMFGYIPEEARLLNVGDLSVGKPPYTKESALPIIKEAWEKGFLIFEWYAKDKGGRCFWVEVNLKTAIIGGKGCLLSIVRDITERKRAEEALREKKEELEIKSKNLEEANAALRVLLKMREEDKTELEVKVLSNVKQLLIPYIEKLKKSKLDASQKGHLDILETNLYDIISPFSRAVSSRDTGLTPTQIQVADLIRLGKTTKEIAELLNLSSSTVDTHRKFIRKKFGIKQKKINLKAFLVSLK